MPELNLPFIGHGGDYNPDQWRDRPDILEEDVRLMKLAGCNLMSVGIFAWQALEPREGEYDFGWLQDVLDRLNGAGIRVFLATPSGARPAWMDEKYPEVRRVRPDGTRNLHGGRHNHCLTSPKYRELVSKIDGALAKRFGSHPAVAGWHLSNELSGDCHCELCQAAFRDWVKARFGTLEAVNHAWWMDFWSRGLTDWSQIHSPTPTGENAVHGLNLSWRRFVTAQTMDFVRCETAAIREYCPDLPVTTNLMEYFNGMNYYELQKILDFVSFDSYPRWGAKDPEDPALFASFNYDWMRSLKQKPFALMESTPSQVNWHDVCKLKKPGMHALSCVQALAHGADTIQYFQWRKSRGGSEKFHGAVVDHVGHEHTRVFRDVAGVGELLKKLNGTQGTMPAARVALLYDAENRWALEDSQGPRRDKHYLETVMEHYRALKRRGVDVDIIDESCDFTPYALIAAPMLYMLRGDAGARLSDYVKRGGTLACTCLTGEVDENDLCFLGGFPGPLREALGIWIEETDALYDDEMNGICMNGKSYPCGTLCDLIHAETARVVGVYEKDFYAGEPCVTVNDFGAGRGWYVASRPDAAFLDDFYAARLSEAGVAPLIGKIPVGVQVTTRGRWLFVMNFADREVSVTLPEGRDAISGGAVGGETTLKVNDFRIIDL